MGFLKVIIKDTNFETHLIDLDTIRDVKCEYPLPDDAAVETDDGSFSTDTSDEEKVTIEYGGEDKLEIELKDKEVLFIVYDSYGDELCKTTDIEELTENIKEARSLEFEPSDPKLAA